MSCVGDKDQDDNGDDDEDDDDGDDDDEEIDVLVVDIDSEAKLVIFRIGSAHVSAERDTREVVHILQRQKTTRMNANEYK